MILANGDDASTLVKRSYFQYIWVRMFAYILCKQDHIFCMDVWQSEHASAGTACAASQAWVEWLNGRMANGISQSQWICEFVIFGMHRTLYCMMVYGFLGFSTIVSENKKKHHINEEV